MTRTLGILVGLTMVVACGSKSDSSGNGTGTGPDDPCEGLTVTPYPDFDATGVYYRTSIEFAMSTVESDATLSITGVTGTQQIVDNRVVFTPDAPLSPSTSYDMTLDWSCGPTTSSFTTSDIGAAATPAGLIGKTYTLDIGAGRFVQPEGIGSLVGGLLETPLLVGVVAADATTVTFKSVPESSTDQCNELSDFDAGNFTENPYFEAHADAVALDIQEVVVTLQNTDMTGAFSASGDKIVGMTLSGTLDVSPLEVIVGSDPCKALAGVGATCEPCPDGVSNSCLTVYVDGLTASEAAGVSLVCP